MKGYAQEDLAFAQRIRKEMWHPTQINEEFQQTLDEAQLQKKYGNHSKSDKDTFRLSKYDLKKLISDQRRYGDHEIDSVRQQVINELTPIDSQSTQIWRDRSYKLNQKIRHGNQLVGRIGSFAFDNDIQRLMEQRYTNNIEQRKGYVTNNAAHAQQVLQINSNDQLYGIKTELNQTETSSFGSQISKSKRPTSNFNRTSSLNFQPVRYPLYELLQQNTKQNNGKINDNEHIRKRMLQIRARKDANLTKADRFNEEVKDEIEQIRSQISSSNKLQPYGLPLKTTDKLSMAASNLTYQSSKKSQAIKSQKSRAQSQKSVLILKNANGDKSNLISGQKITQSVGEIFSQRRNQLENVVRTQNLNQSSTNELKIVDTEKMDGKKKSNQIEDGRSSVTYMTQASTLFRHPLSQVSNSSSRLELKLDFLAKELELEKQNRQRLQSQVSELQAIIVEQHRQSNSEFRQICKEIELKDKNAAKLDLDVSQAHLLARGFVSLQ